MSGFHGAGNECGAVRIDVADSRLRHVKSEINPKSEIKRISGAPRTGVTNQTRLPHKTPAVIPNRTESGKRGDWRIDWRRSRKATADPSI